MEPVLIARNLSKVFSRRPELSRKATAAEMTRRMMGIPEKAERNLDPHEFYALRNVSLELERGDALGIVGFNGAGKSTLLKILLGRLRADEGSVRILGQAGGLIELGAGFHPEQSGRKNIYSNAALLGISSKLVNDRLEEIITFSELEEFIDSPVKTYSSGMHVRLGFSIAIHFVPDLVICDEILAVGDFEFRQKCLQKINELRKERTFILVSHSAAQIAQFCNKALFLHRGHSVVMGDPEYVLALYNRSHHNNTVSEVRALAQESVPDEEGEAGKDADGSPEKSDGTISGQGQGETREEPVMEILNQGEAYTVAGDISVENKNSLFFKEYSNHNIISEVSFGWNLQPGPHGFPYDNRRPLVGEVRFHLIRPVRNLRVGLPFFDAQGMLVAGPDSRSLQFKGQDEGWPAGDYRLQARINNLPIAAGKYWLTLSIADDPAIIYRKHCVPVIISDDRFFVGLVRLESTWTVEAPH